MAEKKIKWKNKLIFRDVKEGPKLEFRDVSPPAKKTGITKWKNLKTSSYKNRYGRTMSTV
tara:strand:+ start:2638 stop:2817 length:180 start_codon:yes stop_codon:yes gene_type:complete